MKFTWFHLMPWPHMPDDFREKHRSVWVDLPSRMYEPEVGHGVYHQYLDQLEFAESVGFDGIGVNEHHANAYGLMPSPNIMAATLTRRTSKSALVVLGNSIALYNPPLRVAEEMAMLDVLSGGRLVVGIGAGWMKEEFEAIGAPDFAARGKVTDEYLKAFVELWTKEQPKFAGDHVRFDNIVLAPKPVQKPYPPIWVGGESGPALRRTATLGDAWYPIGTNPAFPLDSLARFKAGVAKLRALTEKAGRKADAVGLALRCTAYGESIPATAGDGQRRLFSGKNADIAADIRALEEMGVSHLDVGFAGNTVDTMLAEMQRFKKDVLALV